MKKSDIIKTAILIWLVATVVASIVYEQYKLLLIAPFVVIGVSTCIYIIFSKDLTFGDL